MSIQIQLEFIIATISLVLSIKAALERIDLLVSIAQLLNKIAAISAHSIQLLEHQVETFLQ